jgi:hypothetical protein
VSDNDLDAAANRLDWAGPICPSQKQTRSEEDQRRRLSRFLADDYYAKALRIIVKWAPKVARALSNLRSR